MSKRTFTNYLAKTDDSLRDGDLYKSLVAYITDRASIDLEECQIHLLDEISAVMDNVDSVFYSELEKDTTGIRRLHSNFLSHLVDVCEDFMSLADRFCMIETR